MTTKKRSKRPITHTPASAMASTCDEACALLRALAHPGRLLILGHLLEGPKTVTELQALCELSQSQLSQFLSRMKLEGLVACERLGRFQYYSPAHLRVVQLLRAVHTIFRDPNA